MLTVRITPEQRELMLDHLVTASLAAHQAVDLAPTTLTRATAQAKLGRLVSAVKALEDATRHAEPAPAAPGEILDVLAAICERSVRAGNDSTEQPMSKLRTALISRAVELLAQHGRHV